MVIFKEIPVINQDLPDIYYYLNLRAKLISFFYMVYADKVSGKEAHSWPFYRVYGRHSCSLSRPFNLELSPVSNKIIKQNHSRRIDPCSRKRSISGTPVAEPESSWP